MADAKHLVPDKTEKGEIPHNGMNRILAGVATTIVAVVIIGGVVLYADVQQMKGNRFTIADAREAEMEMRAEFNGSLTASEIALKEEWLEGLGRIEDKVDQLMALHLRSSENR